MEEGFLEHLLKGFPFFHGSLPDLDTSQSDMAMCLPFFDRSRKATVHAPPLEWSPKKTGAIEKLGWGDEYPPKNKPSIGQRVPFEGEVTFRG